MKDLLRTGSSALARAVEMARGLKPLQSAQAPETAH